LEADGVGGGDCDAWNDFQKTKSQRSSGFI